MTCPRCHSEFEPAAGVCPECGIRLLHSVSGVMKTSAVMIAAGGERGFYRSVREVPEPLRKQLIETTSSRNSGIIVIADRAGRAQLTQALASREASQARRSEAAAAEAPPAPVPDGNARLRWLPWAGLALVLALSAVFAAFFYRHW